jgi:FAD/FMN-containing dehydrogenase
VVKPTSVDELRTVLATVKKPLSIAGGRFSQGGQIATDYGTVIDMRRLNKIVSLDLQNKTITVQAGITWHEIQNYIDRFNLSVYIMQSYNDFTVGGSLSVNVHARDIHAGSLVHSVESFVIMLADGRLVTAHRELNPELFAGVIGGYGALGVITEVTLHLTDNYKIERRATKTSLKDYLAHFKNSIFVDKRAVFHNGNLDVKDFDTVVGVTWYRTDKPLTTEERLQPRQKVYPKQMIGEQLLRRIDFLKWFRSELDFTKGSAPAVVWRNYEMSYTVRELEPLMRFPTTTILQEYFVPADRIETFVRRLQSIVGEFSINLLNASLRYVPRDTTTVLAYAPQDSFAVVLYINILNSASGTDYQRRWTQELIDAAIVCGGTYYLPYQLFATTAQFCRAYPGSATMRQLKLTYDPENIFSNQLWDRYGL